MKLLDLVFALNLVYLALLLSPVVAFFYLYHFVKTQLNYFVKTK